MKKLFFLTFAAALFTFCTPSGTRVIERPETGLRNTQTIEIDKVILSDTATILYMDAYFQPHWWIRIASDTYLQAKGEKFLITGADGIEIDAEHYMPDSGEDSFILYFPPLPKGIKSFDFIEGDCEDCFKIWDVDLTGNYKPAYGLPAKLRTPANADSSPLPEPELKVAKSKVTVNIYGNKEGFDPEVELSVSVLPKGEMVTVRAYSAENNVYKYEFPVYGTSFAMVQVGYSWLPFIIAPGDDVEIHYDLLAASVGTSRYSSMKRPVYAAFTGTYAGVNNERNLPGKRFDISLFDLMDEPGLWKMNDLEYETKIREVHDQKMAQLDELGVSDNLKTIYSQDIRSMDVFNLLNEQRLRINSQYSQTGDYTESDPTPVSQTKIEALKVINPDDPYWMLSMHFINTVPAISVLNAGQIEDITGSLAGFLSDYYKAWPAYISERVGVAVPEEALEQLRSIANPFFKEAYDALLENERIEKEKALAAGGFTIKETPDVPAADILDAIVAQYKGQPVFIDFWATWCGPCINAMKLMKPLKPEMEEHGVVTIYITGESSPESKWMTMLPDIGGLHYYLDGDSWRTLCDKYDVQGIPQYMIFDKSGNKVYQQVGFPGVGKLKEELEKVW